MIYSKVATTIADQILQLKKRGLTIRDENEAAHFLSNISYYRLAGYWWPMQADKVRHIFKPNSRFDDAITLYDFDRELRALLFDVIERVEICLRTKLIYHMSHEFDPWWFQNTDLFVNIPELVKTLSSIAESIEISKDLFVKDHKKRFHTDNRFPPAWKTLEIATFGNLSKLYGNLKPSVKSKDVIAAEVNTVNHSYLHSWLQSIAQIRNICAHHGRLWNKHLPGRPKILPNPPAPWLKVVPPVTEHHTLYIHVCCMKYLLDAISPSNNFTAKLITLFKTHPSVDLNALGFPAYWKDEPLWSRD